MSPFFTERTVGVFFEVFFLLEDGVLMGDVAFFFKLALGVFGVLETGDVALLREVVDLLLGVVLGGVFSAVDEVFLAVGVLLLRRLAGLFAGDEGGKRTDDDAFF